MSNPDVLSRQGSKPTANEQTVNKSIPSRPFLRPLYRQCRGKLILALLSVVFCLALLFLLFWQKGQQAQSIIQTQLLPLKQQVAQLENLQQAKFIVDELLSGNTEKNWRQLHADLIAVNRQLLRLNSAHSTHYQQWLNQNKAAQDIVERIEKNKSRNQQLKQSSIIQLQLMLLSASNIIEQKSIQERRLFAALQTDNNNSKVNLNSANDYANEVKQLHNIKQLKSLVAYLLSSFENLTILTPQVDFDVLRLTVDQLVAQTKLVPADNKAVGEFIQQIESFKGLVLSKQNALAKWQGYLRLSQSYNLDLLAQQQQIAALLLKPSTDLPVIAENPVRQFLITYHVDLTEQQISSILTLAFTFCFLLFCLALWRIQQHIKVSGQQSLALVNSALKDKHNTALKANCDETAQILACIRAVVQPKYDEQAYQKLLAQLQSHQQLINEQKQALAELKVKADEQALVTARQEHKQLTLALANYEFLQQQVLRQIANNTALEDRATLADNTAVLNDLYTKLEQFYLATYVQRDDAVLQLEDIDLLAALDSLILNQQAIQLANNNQLYLSYDDQVIAHVKLDLQLFNQLLSLLFELTLEALTDATLHLHLQLQDKNSGQQLLGFIIKVNAPSLIAIPADIEQLAQHNEQAVMVSSMVELCGLFLAQMYGKNIAVQALDRGYQLRFELPVAIASKAENSPSYKAVKSAEKTALVDKKIILLATNKHVTKLVENIVLGCAGQFASMTRLDSLKDRLSSEYLSRHKLDLLILSNDMAISELAVIEQQIARLPVSLQPKLMVLQAVCSRQQLTAQHLGFYQQAEQPLIKTAVLSNIQALLAGEATSNLGYSAETLQATNFVSYHLQVLLAVNQPAQYQTLQRLLQYLGLQVVFVCTPKSQVTHWKTGRYSILISEFVESAFVEMTVSPAAAISTPIGVFSLSTDSADVDIARLAALQEKDAFTHWHYGQLTGDCSLAELQTQLATWLLSNVEQRDERQLVAASNEELASSQIRDLVINEVAASLSKEANYEATFDFSHYLENQGSVELALYMLDEYSQENHQQLSYLAAAISDKNIAQARLAAQYLLLNSKILAADDLQLLAEQWLTLLSEQASFEKLARINDLLADTQQVLHAIDSYAETI